MQVSDTGTDGSGRSSSSAGTMWIILSVLLLIGQIHLMGMLSPPQNVTLTSENFHVLLAWEPGSGSGSDTQYEVESCQLNSNWTKVDACWRNSTKSSHTCELYFEDIHKIYFARVRATDGAWMSEWAFSQGLQLYRDTIVGPPKLTLKLMNQNLVVNLSMPLTPYRRRNGTYKPVQKVLWKLQYLLSLSEEDVNINSVSNIVCWEEKRMVPCKPKGKITLHTFENLKPNTNYCVNARVHGQQSKASVQCIKTPDSPADFLSALDTALAALLALLLLSVAGFYFLKLYMYPSTSKMPKTLAILNEELTVNLWNKSPAQDLEGASITLISVAGLASNGNSAMEPERLQLQLLPGGGTALGEEGYYANGFGPGYSDSMASSRSSGQLEFAGTGDLETPLSLAGQMKAGYAGEGNYRTALKAQFPVGHVVFSEQLSPVSAGLAKDSQMGDRGYQTCSATQIPLHLQVYSKHSSPISETCRLSPCPSGAAFSLRDLQKTTDGKSTGWPPMFCVDVCLSSVKLPADEETQDHFAPFPMHLYNHTVNETMKDSKADLGQSDVKQQKYQSMSQEQHCPPECLELSNDPSGEPYSKAGDSKIMASSGYELRPQCFPCS